MKKTLLLITALTLGGIASAQTTRVNAPDVAVVDLGITTGNLFGVSTATRPALGFYGNVLLRERISVTANGGQIWGGLKVGNDYNDLNRLFVEGQLDYSVRNLTVYSAVRQGVYTNDTVGNKGTSFRLGTQIRF